MARIQSKRTRRGAPVSKIARLPAAIRAEINRRLYDGQVGWQILAWLNAEPVVVQTMQALPSMGPAVSQQNLSVWRQTGYSAFLAQIERAAIEKIIRG